MIGINLNKVERDIRDRAGDMDERIYPVEKGNGGQMAIEKPSLKSAFLNGEQKSQP